jgi:hypothetical protein
MLVLRVIHGADVWYRVEDVHLGGVRPKSIIW